jgi:hypothetical protein
MAFRSLCIKSQGIISLESGDYLFRDDHCGEIKFWAWKIEHDNITDRAQCYKWNKLPKPKKSLKLGHVTLFNMDDPPRTIPYLPILD